eukprot:TRINITY_DN18899_c0_g1_i1.p1 TRINITY_DN18899_c0_g1~~TRINITY_DN18899_c0_g1_i1.p1  ORF type:complete len:189 (-),score=48.95 TRINITY_DN18899_c0_g1_i1:263-829(-)
MGYIFDPDVLHAVGKEAIKKHNGKMVDIVKYIQKRLTEKYPGHINQNPKWFFNNAGGAMGAMCILHASLSEYVIIFGTPVGTEGHTGRFLADDYFIILEGEQWAFYPGNFERDVFRPGDMHHLPMGRSQQYRMPEKCWALEYARGAIPLMLPFGIADTLFSTLDFVTLGQTFAEYAKCVVSELAQFKI